MSESQRPGSAAISKPAFFACKAVPVITSLVLVMFNSPFVGSILLLGILTGVELFVCKEYFGIGLVGLRPLPYVASSLDLSAFWGILLFSVMSWSLFTIMFIIWFQRKWVIMEAIFSLVNGLNFLAFLKCNSAGKLESDNIAKTILLDKNESFQNVRKDSDADTETSNAEEESKREENEII